MDIFWSDGYEFVISEKEGMYFTKTIRIEEEDELRHERLRRLLLQGLFSLKYLSHSGNINGTQTIILNVSFY